MGTNSPKPPEPPLSLAARWLHLIHQCLGRPQSPPQTIARWVHAFLHNYATKDPLVTVGRPKFTPKLLLPLWWSPPPSNTPIPRLTPPPQTIARWVHAFPHNYATKDPLVTVGRPKFTPKLLLPLRWSSSHLIHPSLNRPHSPSQTASGSTQPFCTVHFVDRQTDRQTDGLHESSET